MLFSSHIFIISRAFDFGIYFSYNISSFFMSYTTAPFPAMIYFELSISLAIVFIESILLPDAITTSVPFCIVFFITLFVFSVSSP